MQVGFKNPNTGEVLKTWSLNPSQQKFWTSKKRFILFSGGFGCGKSHMLTLKAIELCMAYPGNYVLMGRKTYPELRDTLIKEFFTICPPELISSYLKAESRVVFTNGSEIIFRHLDTIAESEIRSMNLGAAFIDQAEDIPKEVFLALIGRLRRAGIDDKDRKICLSSNPKLTWLYADFKQNPGDDYDLIEASTLENKEHLSPMYVENLLKYPESWKRQYVYGVWDESLLSDRIVFAREYIETISKGIREPIEEREGLKIYKKFEKGHRYQMGIDAAEGVEDGDDAAISIVDVCCLEEVAHWSGKLPPDVVAEKAIVFAHWYQDENSRCLIIPEMNSIGLALVNKLKQGDDVRIYTREEFDKTTGKKLERFGWRTTTATKPLLISRFQELLRLKNPMIHSKKTFDQMKSFVYTDEANKKGMGAEQGFHDDCLISCLLAFWEKGPVQPGTVLRREKDIFANIGFDRGVITPQLKIIKGKAVLAGVDEAKPLVGIDKKWTAY